MVGEALSDSVEIQPHLDEFVTCMVGLETPEDRRHLLEVFLSNQELGRLASRWANIQLLLAGDTQRQVCDATGAASATVGRAAKTLSEHKEFLGKLVQTSQGNDDSQ